jgi:uncharacterized coiled-coil protein SlyX
MHPPVHVGDVSHLHYPCPNCAVSYLRGYYHNLVSVIFGFIDRAICSRLVGIMRRLRFRYEAVNAMLLNELLKEHPNVAEQQTKVAEQESTIAELKTTVAQQQTEIEALTATVQKVSDQIARSKPARQLVANP